VKVILTCFDQYYVRCTGDDGSWDEVYDPRVATIFPSKKAAQDWANNEPQMSKYLKVETDIVGIIKNFQQWLDSGMVRRHFDAPNDYNTLYYPHKNNSMDVLKWNYQHAVQGDDMRVSQKVYESWAHQMFHHFDFIQDFAAYWSNDYREKYISFTIKVGPKSTFGSFKREIDMLLNNFEFTHLDDENNLMIEIFENDLHETRHMVLLMEDRENDKWSIQNLRYNFNGSKELERVSLERAFEELHRHYYYD
jgi:hypothetical protein